MTPRDPSIDWWRRPANAWRLAAREVWLPTASEMAALDRRATSSGAIPERALIENAGRALAGRLQARWPEGTVTALAGSGHNGADALVAGRTLHAWGRDVRLVRCGSRPPEPDVLRGWDLALAEPDSLDRALAGADVVIDGILGTGVDSAPREPQAGMIERVNATGLPVVAVDGPSGVDFTTGAVPGAAISATLTVTFGWPKLGLLAFPAREHCGDIEAVEIGFPPPDPVPAVRAITAAWVSEILGRRGADAHKGRAGYVVVVGGQAGMAGAVVLSARAAIRAGAGIVRVVSAPENREIVQTAVPAAVFVSWDDEAEVEDAVGWGDGVAVGPGLGRGAERRVLVERVLAAAAGTPVVLDADGLNAWSGAVGELAGALAGPALLTPHPGEIARLLPEDTDVLARPLAAARAVAERTGAAVLLKGTPAWVAGPAGPARATVLASPAFAAGGMGDVLAGVAAACAASGLDPADAAASALMISGLAVTSADSPVGFSSDDVPDRLPAARAALEAPPLPAPPGVRLAIPRARATEATGDDGA